jgi:hypothetical protein
LRAVWQLHYSEEAGTAHNTGPKLIANPAGADAGRYLEVVAGPEEAVFVSISGDVSKGIGYGWGSSAGRPSH